MEIISSLQNSRIKNIIKLEKSKERKSQNLFLLEGARELSLAQTANYEIESVFVCPEFYSKSDYYGILDSVPESIMYFVAPHVFQKIAYRSGSDGIIALMRPKSHCIKDIKLSQNPFIIVLEAVEKPGNLGAILRSADAANADAVIVCDPLTDIYNPNVIRSSIGCVFTTQIATCTSDDAYNWLKGNRIKSFAAELTAANWYHKADYTKSSAIVMGTEADGLTSYWISMADERIKIPMRGEIDSLNVSVSTAIITFEAMRQRGF